MRKFGCYICYRRLLSLKLLKTHLLRNHSKIQIIQQLLQQSQFDLFIKKRKSKCNKTKLKQIKSDIVYLEENIFVTYNDKSLITIDKENNDSNNNNNNGDSLQVTFEELPNIPTKSINNETTNDPQSLNESSGEFYQCNCMVRSYNKKKSVIDNTTQTVPELPSTTTTTTKSDQYYYCNFCTTTNLTIHELIQHERIHQFYCDLCDCFYAWQSYQDHFKQHISRIYICHYCGLEFFIKDGLKQHLDQHLEREVINDILDMERDYNFNGYINFANLQSSLSVSSSPSSSSSSSTITTSSTTAIVTNFDCDNNNNHIMNNNNNNNNNNDNNTINSIFQYLTYPYDHAYSRNIFMIITCNICRCNIYACDYQMHLKTAHYRP